MTSTSQAVTTAKVAILGAGNIGRALALGLVRTGGRRPDDVILTRRKTELLDDLAGLGHPVTADNRAAVAKAGLVVVAVTPPQVEALLTEVAPGLDPDRHVVVSFVTGVDVATLRGFLGDRVPLVRAMPNTALALGQSMTCLTAGPASATGAASGGAAGGVVGGGLVGAGPESALDRVREVFDTVGRTLVVDEEQMAPATALGACGVAFFLRAIRAASQGGIEIGFHAPEAITIAAQTALGAASLLLAGEEHPEGAIDVVTTPRGCTIAGLNEMEHRGFSSAMIKGIVTSAVKAGGLYRAPE